MCKWFYQVVFLCFINLCCCCLGDWLLSTLSLVISWLCSTVLSLYHVIHLYTVLQLYIEMHSSKDGFCFTRCLTFPPFCVKLISEPILKTVTPRRKFWPQKLLNYNVKLDFESIMSSLRMDFEKEWIEILNFIL